MGMIKVIGGTLYQWGIGRKVKVTPHNDKSVCEVHFAHIGDANALVVIPTIENGEICAEIPNILLQSKEPICAYAVQKDDDTEKCFCNCTLFVRARPKPEDYIYTETELKNYDDLEARIEQNKKDISNLSSNKADKSYVDSIFEQLKELIQNGGIDSTVAILDEAIFDLSTLA